MMKNLGNLPSKFNETGYNTNGSLLRSRRILSPLSQAVNIACEKIYAMRDNGGSLDGIITDIFKRNKSNVQNYVLSHKDVPVEHLGNLALQAAILRMSEIAKVQDILDTDENDARLQIEANENDIVRKNLPAKRSVLPPEAQAAINIIIERIVNDNARSGGTGKIQDIVNDLAQVDRNVPSNRFAGAPTMEALKVYDQDTSGMPLVPVAGDIEAGGDGPKLSSPARLDRAASVSEEPVSGVLDFIDKTVKTIEDASGKIKTTIESITDGAQDLKDKVTDVLGDVAGDTAKKAIIKNIPLIIAVVVIIAAIVFFMSYAFKNK